MLNELLLISHIKLIIKNYEQMYILNKQEIIRINYNDIYARSLDSEKI